MDFNERPYCGGPSLWCIHYDAHRMDNALRMLRVLLDVAAQAAGDSLRGGHHQSLLGMVLLDQHSGRYESETMSNSSMRREYGLHPGKVEEC